MIDNFNWYWLKIFSVYI